MKHMQQNVLSFDVSVKRKYFSIIRAGKGNIQQIDGVLYSAATTESTRQTNKVNIIYFEVEFPSKFKNFNISCYNTFPFLT